MWKAVELGTGYYYLDLNHSLFLTSLSAYLGGCSDSLFMAEVNIQVIKHLVNKVLALRHGYQP